MKSLAVALAVTLSLAASVSAECTYDRIYQDSDCMQRLAPALYLRLNGPLQADCTYVEAVDSAGRLFNVCVPIRRRRVWIEPYAAYGRATAQGTASGQRNAEVKAQRDLAVSCINGMRGCWQHHVAIGETIK